MAWRNAIISTLMLYQYDHTLFEGFLVPGDMVKETVVDTILSETAELSVIYPSPSGLKEMIRLWTKKNFNVWDELWKTLHYEYNPIHNYDRTEEGLDTLDGKAVETRDLTNRDEFERNLQDNGSNLTQVAAFNQGLADSNKNVGEVTYSGNTVDTKRDTGNVTDKTDNVNNHFLRAYGNIGVTSTQELIQQQRDLVQFNLTDYILNDYKSTFCVLTY